MATFKIINNPFYNDPKSILEELHYIYKEEKYIYKGSDNLYISSDPRVLANQFSYIKSYYRKHSGKQLEHFVLSFDSTDEEYDISLNTMVSVASHITNFVLYEYQTAYAIHKPSANNPCYHIHFIVNSINMLTGHHFRINKSTFYPFINAIADAIRFNHIALRGYSYFDESANYHKGKYNDLALYGKTMKKYKYY